MLLKAIKIFILLMVIFFLPTGLYAQHLQDSISISNKKDSIKIKTGRLLEYKDTIIHRTDTLIIKKEVWIGQSEKKVTRLDSSFADGQWKKFKRDTFIVIQDTMVLEQDTILTRDQRVLKKIKKFTEKRNFFSQLLSSIVLFENKPTILTTPPPPTNYNSSDKKYEPYEGKVIRNLDVKVLVPFGPSLQFPEKRPHGFLQKGGNVLHVKSQRWLIRNRLLFKKGDLVNALKVSESERLIRSGGYIYDAKIIMRDSTADSVDVMVMVQDLWSISGSAGADPRKESYTFGVRDVNFLGLGQTFDNKVNFNPNLPGGYNFSGSYLISNIYKTFITSRFFYTHEFGQTRYGVEANREFISPAIKWAGGVNFSSSSYNYDLVKNDTIIFSAPVSLVQTDTWLGYGLNISGIRNKKYKGSRLVFSGRVLTTRYTQRPILPDTIVNNYFDRNFYLGSIGVLRRRFYKDSYIFRFGRTEDIVEGDLISFTAGVEDRSLSKRPYFGINLALSRYLPPGYIYSRVAVGSFYNNSKLNEGVFLAHLLYFSPLIKISGWKWRHYFGCRYTEGIRQTPGSFINIVQEQGLRGFKFTNLKGISRLVLNYESDVFPPLKMLGFQAALIVFTDLAWIGNNDKLLDKNNFFPAYGLGLRIRNDHLIFNTIQVFLAYYPNNASLGENTMKLYERSRFYYSFYDFQFTRPSAVPFF